MTSFPNFHWSSGMCLATDLCALDLCSCFIPALNSRAKDLEEIKQLTGEIGMQAKTRVGEIRTTTRDDAHKTTPSVSSMGSVVDLAP